MASLPVRPRLARGPAGGVDHVVDVGVAPLVAVRRGGSRARSRSSRGSRRRGRRSPPGRGAGGRAGSRGRPATSGRRGRGRSSGRSCRRASRSRRGGRHRVTGIARPSRARIVSRSGATKPAHAAGRRAASGSGAAAGRAGAVGAGHGQDPEVLGVALVSPTASDPAPVRQPADGQPDAVGRADPRSGAGGLRRRAALRRPAGPRFTGAAPASGATTRSTSPSWMIGWTNRVPSGDGSGAWPKPPP